MDIKIDDLTGTEVAKLLEEHHEDMNASSPPESVHALDIDALKAPDVTFWSAWIDGQLAGCGAIKEIAPGHGEIKSMRTSAGFLRRGVAAKLLQHILDQAKVQGYNRVSLETGTPDEFKPARELYRRFGFETCAPFGSYKPDPYSEFFTIEIQ